jgi:ABC-type uncharacterized transport system auxiliary subunit
VDAAERNSSAYFIGGRRALTMLVGLAGMLLLAGCSILGAGNARERSTIYDLDPRVAADPSWPSVDWQLSLPSAGASRVTDSLRIAVRPTPNELQVYKGAVWSRSPTDMVETAILRTLEDSGKIAAVARQGSGISADYKLVLELRRFESAYTTAGMPPTVKIELNAKLLRSADQRDDLRALIVNARKSSEQLEATLTTANRAMEGFDRELVDKLPGLIARLDSTLVRLDSAAAGADGILNENRAAISSFANDGLSQLGPTLGELRALVRDLRRMSDRLDNNPTRYLLGRDAPKEFEPE